MPTSPTEKHREKRDPAAIAEKRKARRDAHQARLERQRDETKNPMVKALLTRQIDSRAKHVERRAARLEERRQRRETRREKRRVAMGGKPGKRRVADRAPAQEQTPQQFAELNAADSIAAIATMDAGPLAVARASEENRDKPRSTVLAALNTREMDLSFA